MNEQKKVPWMEQGGPAFPCRDTIGNHYKGMSLRDYFAAKALQGIMADPDADGTWDEIAERSYKLADAMLKESEEK